MGESMIVAAVAIAVLMVTTWLVSVVRRDASIVDIVWGFGFVVVSWVLVASLEADRPRQFLLAALTSIWGLRLAGYLARRNLGKGEDFRYQAMRREQTDPLLKQITENRIKFMRQLTREPIGRVSGLS